MLLLIHKFIRDMHSATYTQIARAFQIDLEALKPMLALLIKKGLIEAIVEKSACQKKCGQCPLTTIVRSVYHDA